MSANGCETWPATPNDDKDSDNDSDNDNNKDKDNHNHNNKDDNNSNDSDKREPNCEEECVRRRAYENGKRPMARGLVVSQLRTHRIAWVWSLPLACDRNVLTSARGRQRTQRTQHRGNAANGREKQQPYTVETQREAERDRCTLLTPSARTGKAGVPSQLLSQREQSEPGVPSHCRREFCHSAAFPLSL